MSKTPGKRWLIAALTAVMLLLFASACTSTETIEVPGETVVVEKEVVTEVEVPGETKVVVEEVVKIVEVRAGYVTDPTTSKTVKAPQYGGAFTPAFCMNPVGIDCGVEGHTVGAVTSGVLEKLAVGNWGLDRSVFDFGVPAYIPEKEYVGNLAESWDISADGLTYTFQIRKGIKWHDKAPMNGRELIAEDIVFNFHRITGTGSGYTEPTPLQKSLPALAFESIEAPDDYTMVVKLEREHFGALSIITDDSFTFVYPPEVIKEHGDVTDWRNLVGTGPVELVDWTEGTSLKWAKNPSYWGYDEKYPKNRLPYVDEIEAIIITDPATRMSAMRTGKIDSIMGGGCTVTLDDVSNLERTNPEVAAHQYYQRSNYSYGFNVSEPPFDDIRVRQAMQMSIDVDKIGSAMWLGKASTEPQGILNKSNTTWTIPFEEWPSEVQRTYTYNPEGAAALFDEAGYPLKDGVRFKTNIDALDYKENSDYVQAMADFFGRVGVEARVDVTSLADVGSWSARAKDGLYGGMRGTPLAQVGRPLVRLSIYHSGNKKNRMLTNDPTYDALIDAAFAAATPEEQERIATEASVHAIKQQWVIWGPIAPQNMVMQPWVTGFNGEVMLGNQNRNGVIYSRLWVDSEMKAAMGY